MKFVVPCGHLHVYRYVPVPVRTIIVSYVGLRPHTPATSLLRHRSSDMRCWCLIDKTAGIATF